MYKLICTTYNEKQDGTLQLRNNFLIDCDNDDELTKALNIYGIQLDFRYPSKNSVSNILVGKINDSIVHARIVKF